MLVDENMDCMRNVCLRDSKYADKFRLNIGDKAFTQQFAKFYEVRLKSLESNLLKEVREKWGSLLIIHSS